MKPINLLLTVTGKDRSGIIAGVTEMLFRRGCNLEDVSMTILEGEFAMMLVVCVRSRATRRVIEKDLQKLADRLGLAVSSKELKRRLRHGECHLRGADRYLISVIGRDRTGIVYGISRFLAEHKLNITDLNSRILGYGKRAVYSMLLEVDVPKRFPIAEITKGLARLQTRLRIEIQLKPIEPVEL